jgi:ferredoxin
MADKSSKVAKNVPGKYYVDTNCISCGQCKDIAPDYFSEDSDNGIYYVTKQPSGQEAVENCEQALTACPVEAIGNDGE